SIGIIRRRDRVEARLLFVTEGLIEALEGRAHGLHGRKHDLQTALHRRKPSSRDAGQVLRATGLEHLDGFGARGLQFVERRTLRGGGRHGFGTALDRPVGGWRGGVAAAFRGAALGTVRPCRIATGARAAARAPAAIVSVRFGIGAVSVRAAVGVRTVDAVVDIIVGIGPEVVIGIRPVNIIEQVVIGVGPEQRSEPAKDEAATPPRPGRTRERTVEARLPELRLQGDVGDGAVTEHPATGIAPACRGTPERVGRGAGEPMARAESGTLRTTASERTTCNARSSHARPADMRRAGETAASGWMSRNMRAADARPTNMRRTEGSAAVPAQPA